MAGSNFLVVTFIHLKTYNILRNSINLNSTNCSAKNILKYQIKKRFVIDSQNDINVWYGMLENSYNKFCIIIVLFLADFVFQSELNSLPASWSSSQKRVPSAGSTLVAGKSSLSFKILCVNMKIAYQLTFYKTQHFFSLFHSIFHKLFKTCMRKKLSVKLQKYKKNYIKTDILIVCICSAYK